MNEVDELLDVVIGTGPTDRRATDEQSWLRMREAGLDRVALDERLGGTGGRPSDAAVVVIRAAQAGLWVPVADVILAIPLLAEHVTRPVDAGVHILRFADGLHLDRTAEDVLRIRGRLDTTWSESADVLWLVASPPAGSGDRDVLVRLPRSAWRIVDNATPAEGDERATIEIEATLPVEAWDELDAATVQAARVAAALGDACTGLGAARGAVAMAADYAQTRSQFGRPLFAMQVVRHEVALLIEELSACEAAVAHALDVVERHGVRSSSALVAVASACVQVADSGEVVSRVTHQVHGAIGMTAEYPLHTVTRRLWRLAQSGLGDQWSAVVARTALQDYEGDLWRMITDQDA